MLKYLSNKLQNANGFGEKHSASGDAHQLTSACSLGYAKGYEKPGFQVCKMLLSGSKPAAINISSTTFPLLIQLLIDTDFVNVFFLYAVVQLMHSHKAVNG